MIIVPVSYLVSFFSAWLLNSDGADLGFGRTNNGWIIWTGIFLALVLAGILWELNLIWRKEIADS